MKIYSFDGDINGKIKRDSNQYDLFNLFQKNMAINTEVNLPLTIFIVPREYEMRLDRISKHIYGSDNYVEELMVLNNIINPYSVKEGDYIYFCDINNLKYLYVDDDMSDDNKNKRQELINSSNVNKNNKISQNDQNLPKTIKPSNLEQIKITKDNKVLIINSFQ